MKKLKLFFLFLSLLQMTALWAGDKSTPQSDQEAMLTLQRIVAKQAPYSPELAATVRKIVFQVGKKARYKHQVTTLLNMKQGYADLLFSRSFPPFKEDIPNFSQVDRTLYRGGQPNEAGFRQLKELGVTTIINLRLEDNSEEAMVLKYGMKSVHIPIPDTTPPSLDQVRSFLAIVQGSHEKKVFVHCAAGKNRTSAMVAAWRIEHGMKPENALNEALGFGLHPDFLAADRIEDFIRRYSPGKAAAVR